jgi:hypothetical protein
MSYKQKIVCFLTVFVCAVSQAQSGLVASYDEAYERIDQIFNKEKLLPRLEPLDSANIIKQLSDSTRWLNSENLNDISHLCEKANNVTLIYTLHGLKERLNVKEGDPQAMANQLKQLMAENYKKYSSELELLEPFAIRCLAKLITPMGLFIKTLKPEAVTQIRLAGVSQMKGGIINVYIGSMQSALDEKITQAHLLALLTTLSDVSDIFSEALGVGHRQLILSSAKGFKPNAPASAIDRIDRIIVSMSRTDCVKLCQY